MSFISQIPLGDFGDPLDIAEVSSFLASTRSKYITGASFDVNGGLAWFNLNQDNKDDDNAVVNFFKE